MQLARTVQAPSRESVVHHTPSQRIHHPIQPASGLRRQPELCQQSGDDCTVQNAGVVVESTDRTSVRIVCRMCCGRCGLRARKNVCSSPGSASPESV